MIIPTALRKVMKEKLHHGHIGIQRTRARARQVMFWPGLNAEIIDMISKCSACIENQAYQQKEPPIFHEIPTELWFKVGMDLFLFRNKSYLVIIGYYSRFVIFIIRQRALMSSVMSKQSLRALVYLGSSSQITVLSSQVQISKTLQNLGTLSTKQSSPDYPKANGMAERAIKAV